MEKIYENIKSYRMMNGWSQEELAGRAGYRDKGMISRIENGKIDLPLSKVMEFAKIFRVRPSVLMGWAIETPEEIAALQHANLLDKYQSLDPCGKKAVDFIIDHESKKCTKENDNG